MAGGKRHPRILSLTSSIVALSVGVLLPVAFSTAVGIVAIVTGKSSQTLVLGILATSCAAASIGGAIVVVVLLGRRARLARMQSDLVANVSHELRTPLSAIKMYAQTMQAGYLDDNPEERNQCCAVILRECNWLEVMIQQLLTWRSAAKDRKRIEREEAPIGPTLHDACQRFEMMVDPEDIDYSVDIETEATISHDQQAIQSVMLNLLVNAYKYSPKQKSITVKAIEDDEKLGIHIQDQGIGIPEAEQKKIFDSFYQIRSASSSKGSGAGLGLAIARHFAREHGGDIKLQSQEGKGSTFTLWLPKAESKANEE